MMRCWWLLDFPESLKVFSDHIIIVQFDRTHGMAHTTYTLQLKEENEIIMVSEVSVEC